MINGILVSKLLSGNIYLKPIKIDNNSGEREAYPSVLYEALVLNNSLHVSIFSCYFE